MQYFCACNVGVLFLNESLLVTTSIDQRLNMWSYDSGTPTLKLTSSVTHDVADVASMKVLRNRLAESLLECYCLSPKPWLSIETRVSVDSSMPGLYVGNHRHENFSTI